MNNFSYPIWLQEKNDARSANKKSDRTRALLKVAVAELLNDTPYQDLHITSICEQANVGAGTFYRYFPSKRELTEEVLEDVIAKFSSLMSNAGRLKRGQSMFELLTEANVTFIKFADANHGLFRCLLNADDQEYRLGSIVERSTASWALRVTKSILRSNESLHEACTLISAHCLASMTDDIVARLTFRQDDTLRNLISDSGLDEENLAKFLAVLWHRVIFGCDPEGQAAADYLSNEYTPI
ncbi:MAG: TetR/AcrR family transcriptional regulator [Kordiimonadaceae bacterium]|nr:TetR/AcrR family transcriptional regulator [Kordiimonadaceae bacterium]